MQWQRLSPGRDASTECTARFTPDTAPATRVWCRVWDARSLKAVHTLETEKVVTSIEVSAPMTGFACLQLFQAVPTSLPAGHFRATRSTCITKVFTLQQPRLRCAGIRTDHEGSIASTYISTRARLHSEFNPHDTTAPYRQSFEVSQRPSGRYQKMDASSQRQTAQMSASGMAPASRPSSLSR